MKSGQRSYSQARALWAINKASFKAIISQPVAIVFSILFPIIFTMIFGAFGEGGAPSYRIAMEQGSDTTNPFYMFLRNNRSVRIVTFSDTAVIASELKKGKLTGVLSLRTAKDSAGASRYIVKLRSTTASGNTIGGFLHELEFMQLKFEQSGKGAPASLITIEKPEISEVKRYKPIDFILPGQLGFSILFSTLFGIAFLFYSLREQLVLKRFFATPVSKINILVGIGTSRLLFQLMSVIILIVFGHFFFDFSLRHGFLTVVEILIMTIIMLFLLMGVGFIFGSVAKNDSYIPLLINLFGFPQMMLSGTFFSIEVFPKWLQKICQVLPLTQYNDAIRKISFEGLSIFQCGREIGILAIWMAVIYLITIRVLKWEK
ncbi:MAG: ABC transporter permease [Bacteroidetes bacterium]|nr:ABC transporter permease [Bacteroidota bacterium]